MGWAAQWRVDNANEELLKEVRDSGLMLLGLGVESMSNKILRSMKKYTTTEQVNEAFELAVKLGITTGGNLIFGDINETEETVNESLEWFFAHPEYDISLAMIRSIPDSEVWRYTVDKGFVKDKKDFFEKSLPLINFSKLSNKVYERCSSLSIAASWFYFTLKGKIIESKRLPELFEGKHVYRFKVECPKCNAVTEYRHYSITNRPLTPVLCRTCYKKLAVDTRKIFNKEYSLIVRTFINQIRLFYILHIKKLTIFRGVEIFVKKLAHVVGLRAEFLD